MKRDFKMGTFGALLLEGRLPPRRGGASEASTLIKVLPHIEQNAIEILHFYILVVCKNIFI